MMTARETITEVKANTSQHSSSKKDEVLVMRAMLNDRDFKVGVYDTTGKVGEYCPSQEIRKTISGIVSSTTRITGREALDLVDNYEFTKTDANAFINLSKEFVNSYLSTGRKLPLGGRETSNVELVWKHIDARTTETPKRNGTGRIKTDIPAHDGIRAISPCPAWVTK